MIRYRLVCEQGHTFESWFANSDTFDNQAARALVLCPSCGSTRVAKTIMAPAVLGGARKEAAKPATEAALLDTSQRELRAAMAHLRAKVLAEAQDVGSRFPEEARAMHEGDVPHRHIHGQATPQEARDLIADGVLIFPLPNAAEDLN